MSTNGETATRTLKAEVDAAIEDIKEAEPAAKCAAHEPLVRGVVALLRVQSVQLGRQAESYTSTRRVRLGVVGKVVGWALTAALGAAAATAWGLGK
jgi:hypothetical protein